MASVHNFENELAEMAARRLRAEFPAMSDAETADRARLVALCAFAFVRHAWFAWIDHPDTNRSLGQLVEEAFERGAELVASSYPAQVG